MKKIWGLFFCVIVMQAGGVLTCDGGAAGSVDDGSASVVNVIDTETGCTSLYNFISNVDGEKRPMMDVLKRLINSGAYVDFQDPVFGFSPLHITAQKNFFLAAKCLIESGADKNIQSHDGITPLHWAVFCGHLGMVKLLLYFGADCNIKATFSRIYDRGYPVVVTRNYHESTPEEVARIDAEGTEPEFEHLKVPAGKMLEVFVIFKKRWNPLRRAWITSVIFAVWRREDEL